MEYIKKEDLKDGDIYVTSTNFINKYSSLQRNPGIEVKYNNYKKDWYLSYINMRMATSEEKHWLNCCIKQDKFITFEEAMKTFIPEYVECIKEETRYSFYGKLGTIYKVIDWNHSVSDCRLEGTTSGSTCKQPSCKLAY